MNGLYKREWAARLLAATGAADVLARVVPNPQRLTILAYHRIYDMGGEDTFPFDPELVSATPQDFRWQMEQVLSAGSPITFARLAEALDAGARLPNRPIIVTFDDGFRDNFTHAFPVLKELGIPATVFLATGYVGKRGTFWFDRVAQLIYRAPARRLTLSGIVFEAQLNDDVPSRRTAADRILRILKEVPDEARRGALAELEDSLGSHAPYEDEALSGAMTWDDVRAMARHGVEFGSQTVTHPILTRLDDASLAEELTASRRAIEKELGQFVTAIAYPVGGTEAFDERVVAASAQAGYRFGVSYVSGVNIGLDDPYRLKRLHVERYTSRPYFKCLLAAPGIFA